VTGQSIVVILHIIAVALWFGSPLFLSSTLKKGREAGRDGFRLASGLAAKAAKVAGIGALLALVTGVGLIFLTYGGFKGLPKNYHAALGLVLIGNAVRALIIGRTVKALNSAAWQPDWTPDAATPGIKRVAMGVGINHLIWMSTLVLMYVRF
jgi:uncharacterized membrane protein